MKLFIKIKTTVMLLVVLTMFSIAYKAVAAEQPPNIVFILSDDQAWTDYGFMGHKDIKTPHLNKLADRSLLFERGYVASPLCRPSLASLATGLYPFQHGVAGNDVGSGKKRAKLDIPWSSYPN
jgi:arylsulfatase A-like enzyme|tara:strand:+ start:873 stop:1241 length:369 start_codon:yes stop_codon:yes gene_type:complete